MKNPPDLRPFLVACLFLVTGAPAFASDTSQVVVSQSGDARMTCDDIRTEVAYLGNVIDDAKRTQDSLRVTDTGLGVAKTVGAYLVGTLGGALGVLAAGHLVGEATDDRAEAAARLEDEAAMRRSLLAGIYKGKECEGMLPFIEEAQNVEPAAGNSQPKFTHRKRSFND